MQLVTRPLVRRRLMRAAAAVLAAALSAALVYLLICGYMASSLTRAERIPISRTPEAYDLPFEPVRFASRVDHLSLSGWLIAPPAGVPVGCPIVSVHGKGGNRENGPGGGSLAIAADLARAGHDVLLFDLRGAGESEGDRFTLGAREVNDLAGAIDFIAGRGLAADGVGLIGYSMGAATALLQSAADPRVRAVVEDSGYAELGDLLDVQIPRASGLPRFFTPGTIFMARPLLGIDAYAIRPVDRVPALATRGTPLLVIHGLADTLIPPDHGRRIAAAYGKGVETLFVAGAEHVSSYAVDRTTYLGRVIPFFARADAAG